MNAYDAYKTLGLREGAAADEVKAAYRTLAQKYNPESYDAGPLRDDAAARMDEINAAFDAVMTDLRTGDSAQSGADASSSNTGADKYAAIRQMINSGNVENALAQLNGIAGGAEEAEWNFLVGSAYYYKGWVNDALRYFTTAAQRDPSNREYAAALQNLQNSQRGNMNGSPYQTATSGYGMQGGCSCCDMCTAMMCMDMCCGCGGRGC